MHPVLPPADYTERKMRSQPPAAVSRVRAEWMQMHLRAGMARTCFAEERPSWQHA